MGVLHEQRNDLLWYLVDIEKRRKKVGKNNSTAGRPRSDPFMLMFSCLQLFHVITK